MKVYIFLADGFEEIEAVATLDVLRRGGVEAEFVSIGSSLWVRGSRGISVEADRLLGEVVGSKADCLVFPGGMPGSRNLAECGSLLEWAQAHYDAGGWLAAICAAPAWVLGRLRLPQGVPMTCYPGVEGMLPGAALRPKDEVVVSERVVTASGPGYALAFGCKLVELLVSRNKADEVAAGLLKT